MWIDNQIVMSQFNWELECLLIWAIEIQDYIPFTISALFTIYENNVSNVLKNEYFRNY